MQRLERAIQIATEAHEGEFRRDGTPYVEHPLRVMAALAAAGSSEEVQSVGVMHDVFENSTKFTFDDLIREGFSADVVNALKLLTKPYLDKIQKDSFTPEDKARRYKLYIQQLIDSANTPAGHLAIPVKIEDINDNYDNKNKRPLYDWALRQLGACSVRSSRLFERNPSSGLYMPCDWASTRVGVNNS